MDEKSYQSSQIICGLMGKTAYWDSIICEIIHPNYRKFPCLNNFRELSNNRDVDNGVEGGRATWKHK